MATVLHGRRKGQSRATPDKPEAQIPTVNVHEVTVLSKNDWDQIQLQLNKRRLEEERLQQKREERERLHELSREKVKNWGNTIAGQRQKKLEARHKRELKEEEEKKQIDIEEAKFQAQKRKAAIERAKTQQYYQTDRVKGFHGALLLTEVLKEREAQLELKSLKEKASAGKDREWLQKAQREYEESILRDQEEARKRIKQCKDTAVFQKSQIKNHLEDLDRERQDDIVEGGELKRLAAQYQMEKAKLEEIRSTEAKQLMADNVKQIEDVVKMRKVHQQQEEEEDEECRIFAAAKRKMMKLRGHKEKELHIEKQKRLEGIRQKLHAQMQQKKDDEDDRIKRAQEEAEKKRAKEEEGKEKWNRKMQQEMAEHRHQQMSEKEKKEIEDRRKELEMLKIRRDNDELFARNEEEKARRRLDEAKTLQNFHVAQVDERVTKEQESLQEQLAQDKKNVELLAVEEQQFQEYAQKVIDHCDQGGRNVYPLRKAAREGAGGGLGPVFPGKGGVRPSYMVQDQSGVQLPNYQRGTTEDAKKNIYGDGNTRKRLGFVW